MSKHLVPPVTIKTSAEIFNNEDGLALQRYSTFSGFKVNNISIPKLFPEFTDNDDHGTFVIPEKVGDDNFWPESETFMANCDKRKAFFFPHCFIPKILFHCNPWRPYEPEYTTFFNSFSEQKMKDRQNVPWQKSMRNYLGLSRHILIWLWEFGCKDTLQIYRHH